MRHRDLESSLSYLRIKQEQLVIMYGKKKIGKTYFIKEFIEKFNNENNKINDKYKYIKPFIYKFIPPLL